ncbi:MAG: CvpA family protein [Pseudomonadales bacterium]|nr:CvpA family protein [Pseudomonadales bacterium]
MDSLEISITDRIGKIDDKVRIMLDILFLAVVSYYMWKGYTRGVVKVLGGFLSLVLAYFCAYRFNFLVVEWFEKSTELKGAVLYASAGGAIFLSVLVLANLLFFIGMKLLERRGIGRSKSNGMLAGLLVGCVFGAVVVWLGGIIQSVVSLKLGGATQTLKEEQAHAGPDIHEFVASLVSEGLERTLESRMPEDSAVPKLAGELARDPVSFAMDMKALSDNRPLRELYGNPQTRALLERGDVANLMKTDEYQRFINHPATMRLAAKMFEGKTTAEQQSAFTQSLGRISRGATLIQGNPRFQALMEDPEVRRILQNPVAANPISLLTNPKINELVELIMTAADSDPYVDDPDRHIFTTVDVPDWQSVEQMSTEPEAGEHRIYRWVDEKGRVHYSEDKPEGVDDYQVTGG